MTKEALIKELGALRATSDPDYRPKGGEDTDEPLKARLVLKRVCGTPPKYIKYNPFGIAPQWGGTSESEHVLGNLSHKLHTEELFKATPWWPSEQLRQATLRAATMLIIGIAGSWTSFHVDATEAVNVAIALVSPWFGAGGWEHWHHTMFVRYT